MYNKITRDNKQVVTETINKNVFVVKTVRDRKVINFINML